MNPKVDFFFSKDNQWHAAFEKMRAIILDCGLDEELKWGNPCYTYGKKNIVLIHGFKEYCAILFFKGALLQDPDGVLIQQTENVQAPRQMRFANAKQVTQLAKTIKAYVYEAIEVEQAGLKVEMKKSTDLVLAEELQSKLDEDAELKKAFEALTPGRQRAYNLYFSAPKQSKTRESRIEKYYQQILDGKGLND